MCPTAAPRWNGSSGSFSVGEAEGDEKNSLHGVNDEEGPFPQLRPFDDEHIISNYALKKFRILSTTVNSWGEFASLPKLLLQSWRIFSYSIAGCILSLLGTSGGFCDVARYLHVFWFIQHALVKRIMSETFSFRTYSSSLEWSIDENKSGARLLQELKDHSRSRCFTEVSVLLRISTPKPCSVEIQALVVCAGFTVHSFRFWYDSYSLEQVTSTAFPRFLVEFYLIWSVRQIVRPLVGIWVPISTGITFLLLSFS